MSKAEKHDARGSIWRRWDLHFHTPASFDYRDKSVTNEQIIAGLRANNIDVVAITDHHIIDPQRIVALRALAGDDITILPGIELRSELGGSTTIHYIGIFPEDADVHDLWTNLQGKLEISPLRVKSIGDERVYVKYDLGMEVIRELGGLVSIHAGNRSNSLEKIKNKPTFKQQVKTDILRDHVNILEVSNVDDCDGYRNIVFPDIKFSRPIVTGSDNHNILQYECDCPCWIRGDATFAALNHVCCEPHGRVFIGDKPPLLTRVANNRTRYIQSIEIRKAPEAPLKETWFDCFIPLNHGMVAIIGNKGSGKSALADILGLLGDSQASDAFSFLTADKFCKPNNNKAKSFRAGITWESGGSHSKGLWEQVEAGIESVKYLPQEYIEGVCNELQEHGSGRFSQELASVIFSHVDPSDRLGCASFGELLKYKTSEKQRAIDVRRESLKNLIDRLVEQERLAAPSNLQSIKEQIEAKKRELQANDLTKPEPVPKPEEDDSTRAASEAASGRLKTLSDEIDRLRELLKAGESRLSAANRRIAAAKRLATRLAAFEAEVKNLREQSKSDCDDLGLSIDNILTLRIDTSKIDLARNAAVAESNEQAKILDPQNTDGPHQLIAELERQSSEIRASLAGPAQRYQQYITEYKAWDTRRIGIEGAENISGTLRHFEKQLRDCESVAKDIPGLFAEVLKCALMVYDDVVELAAVYGELYAPVQKFIENHPLARAQFHMSFETKIVEQRFLEEFISKLALNKRGSFNGAVEGRERVRTLLKEADFNSREGTADFVTHVWNALHRDLRSDPSPTVQVADQLAKGATAQSLYQQLFGLQYLSPFFTLRWAGKDVQQLSPGERGTLLLVFYLLIDRSDIPLIIDQPEENLDNQTVYDVLVPSIKEARDRRQLIIVTHNPNLAVVCDADQVICATIDKERGNAVTYTCGAIENPVINKRLIDVLEGTRPAFANRDSKYHPELGDT